MKNHLEHFELIRVMETDSTNNLIRMYDHALCEKEFIVVSTDYQTQGRGQRGNHWESERGKNLLFSISCQPTFLLPHQQFLISQIISLSIVNEFYKSRHLRGFSIKWPNDIYWNKRKLGGILIENDLAENCIARSIIGVGLNINQTRFNSDAINSVSTLQISGAHYKRIYLLEKILQNFENYYRILQTGKVGAIREEYRNSLLRSKGTHIYRDAHGTFEASIDHVEDNGLMVLRDTTGQLRSYSFKELTYVF